MDSYTSFLPIISNIIDVELLDLYLSRNFVYKSVKELVQSALFLVSNSVILTLLLINVCKEICFYTLPDELIISIIVIYIATAF